MLFEEPLRTARTQRQGVWFEVYRIPRGAELYMPDPFGWDCALRLQPPVAREATIYSLAAEWERRRKFRATAGILTELAAVLERSRALRRASQALRRRGAAVGLELHQLGPAR